jgi:hypothetical protein
MIVFMHLKKQGNVTTPLIAFLVLGLRSASLAWYPYLFLSVAAPNSFSFL